MNKAPAFQFYPDKWQSHTRHLSDSAYRVFHEILCWMWQHADDQCSIPSHPEAISTLLAMPCERIAIALQELTNSHAPLLKTRGKKFISDGLRKEAEKLADRRAKMSNNSKQRWKRDVTTMQLHSIGNANGSFLQCSPSPTPSPTPFPIKEREISVGISEDSSPSPSASRQSSDLQANPPTLDQCIAAATRIGMTKAQVESYFHARNSQGWIKSNGRPITSLESDLVNWKNREQTFDGGDKKRPQKTAKDMKREEEEARDKEYLRDYTKRFEALRSWFGMDGCPYGDPREEYRRLWVKIEDNHGKAFARKLKEHMEAVA